MGQPETPEAPDQAREYQRGINVFLQNLPRMLQAEQEARGQYDPERIAQQQDLQEFFGPTQYRQQLDALEQLDPESGAIRRQLAGRVSEDLASGYRIPEDYETEVTSDIRGAQAARGNSLGSSAAGAEAAFKGKAAIDLYQQHLQNAGNFLSTSTPVQQAGMLQGVSPDRSSAYTNPGAGYAGVNMGQQNYQNMLAQYQLAGGGRSPWAGAATGAASGAMMGAQSGNPWGAIIGGVVGGAAGYFSDTRLKKDITEIGVSVVERIPIITFRFIADPLEELYVGVRAQDVKEVRPDCVFEENGFLTVDYKRLGIPFGKVIR